LLITAPDRWILKGGLALDFRLGDRARATIDMDLGRQDGEASADADLRAAQAADLGDYFTFEITRKAQLDDADVAGAVRYRVNVSLAARRFEGLVVDVGFTDPPVGKPDDIPGPDLLAFADVPPLRVPALPLLDHVAEKVHAYTRRYGPLERFSTRVKDLVDLVLLQSTSSFLASELRSALLRTFETRATHSLPPALPEPPPEWEAPYRRLAANLSIPAGQREGYRSAAAFLAPILDGTLDNEVLWDPGLGAWTVYGRRITP